MAGDRCEPYLRQFGLACWAWRGACGRPRTIHPSALRADRAGIGKYGPKVAMSERNKRSEVMNSLGRSSHAVS